MFTNVQIEYLSSDIEDRLRLVMEALEAGSEDMANVALDQSRVGRLPRMDALQQQAMSIGFSETLKREKRRLEAALSRVRLGDFGTAASAEITFSASGSRWIRRCRFVASARRLLKKYVTIAGKWTACPGNGNSNGEK